MSRVIRVTLSEDSVGITDVDDIPIDLTEEELERIRNLIVELALRGYNRW